MIMALLYARILSILPGRDFFETTEFFLGKIICKAVWLLLACFSFLLCVVMLTNFGQLAVTTSLQETPVIAVYIVMAAVCAAAVKSGIETIGRWSQIIIYIAIGFAVIMFSVSLGYSDINNMLPVLYNGPGPVIKGAVDVLVYPFASVSVLLLVFPAFGKEVSRYRIFCSGLLIGGVMIHGIITSVVMTMGFPAVAESLFPTYLNLKIMKIGDFLPRLEILGILPMSVSLYLNLVVLMLAACRGFAHTVGFQSYRFIVWPVTLLMISFAMFSFDSVLSLHRWFYDVFPAIALVSEIVIPLIVLLVIEIKYRALRQQNRLPT